MKSSSKPILIIDNYDSFTYNLVQMLSTVCSAPVKVVRNDEMIFEDIVALRPAQIVLSPGPGHPLKPRDFGVCREVVQRQEELRVAVLGVCLGHQGIAACNGAVVEKLPVPVHGKASAVRVVSRSNLFEGMNDRFAAMRYHSLYVSDSQFPSSLRVTARSADGVIMALEHKLQPIYGIQFHPESIGTPEGKKLMENFANLC